MPLCLRAAVLALLLSTLGFASAREANPSVVAKLAQTGELSCEPTLPNFCSNIHVECAGRLTLETFPFKLRATQTYGWIEAKVDPGGIAERYQNSRVHWETGGEYIILQPTASNGYIKVLANGTYSFRHYQETSGAMSYGRCY